MNENTLIITGGYGFIGSALCRYLYKNTNFSIVIIDNLTYASNIESLNEIINDKRIKFYKGSIGNQKLVNEILNTHKPKFVFNLAAETHVDNSINNPSVFIQTNILDTYFFIQEILSYYKSIEKKYMESFRLLHISTDEVYGDISLTDNPVTETAPYKPSSPYSATKASGDHIIKSFYRTFGLPALISHCSNNYGPFQNYEKFIPVIINSVLNNKKIPVYGDGMQIREWLFVEDHCDALYKIINKGVIGENYNIGNSQSITNISLIYKIIDVLIKNSYISNQDYEKFISFVPDRLGHDRRYAINCEKIKIDCGWEAKTEFNTGIEHTIKSYIKNNINLQG